jgi:hypothetical protein
MRDFFYISVGLIQFKKILKQVARILPYRHEDGMGVQLIRMEESTYVLKKMLSILKKFGVLMFKSLFLNFTDDKRGATLSKFLDDCDSDSCSTQCR